MQVRLLFTSICVIALVHCSGSSPKAFLAGKYKLVRNQGNSIAYADGYVAGCSSGKGAAGDEYFKFKKDILRFSNDRGYANGWQEGYDYCHEETLNLIQEENMQGTVNYYRANTKAIEEKRSKMWDELKK